MYFHCRLWLVQSIFILIVHSKSICWCWLSLSENRRFYLIAFTYQAWSHLCFTDQGQTSDAPLKIQYCYARPDPHLFVQVFDKVYSPSSLLFLKLLHIDTVSLQKRLQRRYHHWFWQVWRVKNRSIRKSSNSPSSILRANTYFSLINVRIGN